MCDCECVKRHGRERGSNKYRESDQESAQGLTVHVILDSIRGFGGGQLWHLQRPANNNNLQRPDSREQRSMRVSCSDLCLSTKGKFRLSGTWGKNSDSNCGGTFLGSALCISFIYSIYSIKTEHCRERQIQGQRLRARKTQTSRGRSRGKGRGKNEEKEAEAEVRTKRTKRKRQTQKQGG